MVCLRSLVVAILALSSGCPSTAGGGKEEVVVFAASSLTDAFVELKEGFERAYPQVFVRLTFAGSQVLRLQVEQGAAADVFASANERHMQALVTGGYVSQARTFVWNELVVIVPATNPAGILRFDELDRATRIVVGSGNVPVGIYTRQLFQRTSGQLGREFVKAVQSRIVSEENNVRLVRAKVELGEADAAIVYRTDGLSSSRVRLVTVPNALNVRAGYQIGAVERSPHRANALRFLEYVFSSEGQNTLELRGFISEVE